MPNAEEAHAAVDAIRAFLDSKKGKKSPNKADSAEFAKLWRGVVHDAGLSKAMPLLCEGFRFSEAKPLYDYVKEEGNSASEYRRVGMSPSVKDSKNEIELRINLSLLSYELIEPTSIESISLLVKRIPTVASNKEGKTSGNLSGYVLNLLVRPLVDRQLSQDVASALKPDEVESLSKTIEPCLREFVAGESGSVKEVHAAKNLISWFETSIGTKQDAKTNKEEAELDKPCTVPREHENTVLVSQEEYPHAATHEKTGNDPETTSQTPSNEKNEVEIESVIAFIRKQQKQIDSARSRIAFSESEIARLQEEKTKLASQIAELEGSLGKSKERAHNLASELDFEKERSAGLETELAAAREYAEIVAKSAAKETEEANARLARKLRIEYQDFQDALEIEMNADLGENMRIQLQSVFKILKENGFDL